MIGKLWSKEYFSMTMDETSIALDKHLEEQPKWSLITCSKCPFDQKGVVMSYENLLVAMNCHTRISGVLAHTASLVK